MDVRFRVLPFELPLYATSYDNPTRKYISHLNFQCEIAEGLTYEERRASAPVTTQFETTPCVMWTPQ